MAAFLFDFEQFVPFVWVRYSVIWLAFLEHLAPYKRYHLKKKVHSALCGKVNMDLYKLPEILAIPFVMLYSVDRLRRLRSFLIPSNTVFYWDRKK